MWTVICVAQSKDAFEQIKKIIEDNDIITRVRTLKKDDKENCYEILVPASEVCRAHDLILETEL